MNEFSIQSRVYLEDTDAGGIVYYVNYLKFMERARSEFLRVLGFEFQSLKDIGSQFVVHSLEVRYKRPAQMDDELIITASINKVAKTYVVFNQHICRGSELMCEAMIKVACVGCESLKPEAIPQPLISRFQSALSNS